MYWRAGRAALEDANTALGLALAPTKIDYLLAHYRKLAPTPRCGAHDVRSGELEHCRHKSSNASWIIDGASQEETLFRDDQSTHGAHPAGGRAYSTTPR